MIIQGDEETINPIVLGIIGSATPIAASAVSLATVIAWLQVASLTVGIAVGILTLVVMWKRMRREDRLNE